MNYPPNPFEALAWGMVDLIGGANEMRLDGVAIHLIEDDAKFIAAFTIQSLGIEELGATQSSYASQEPLP